MLLRIPITWFTSMGFEIKPFIPFSAAILRSSSKAFAVMAIMGIAAAKGCEEENFIQRFPER